ncbi:hypothetical protein PMIN04_003705 [Paraphaeosphaeria minitans]|uniref:SAP domain-containing protein n=1 Tax=Paraphaeosphaeria minitans TaxID=565426 RepID=A0A9P6G5L9_9PLEO|nr:hypothetical protein PMIN01_12395 [Paraphaeosphaeria minitans]
MSDYKKMKSHELGELLVLRGLDASGTKTQMMSRLVMQDAEQIKADKALAAAIYAASNSPSPHGNENEQPQGEWSKVKKGGTERTEAGKNSDMIRRARLENGRQAGKGKGQDIGGGGYFGVLGEGNKGVEKLGKVDEDAFVKNLLAGGGLDGRQAVQESQENSGIIVNQTKMTPTMRGGAGRAHTLRKTSTPRTVPDDDDALNDAPTVCPSSFVTPERIPPPQDNDDFEKSGKSGKKPKVGSKKNGKTGAHDSDAVLHEYLAGTPASKGSRVSMKVFLWALFIAIAYIFWLSPGSMTEVWSYFLAFVKDPVGSICESITGPK